ncbi:MAG: tetratricopeptide repeat protein [Planctomycetota bacterium]
MARPTLSLRQAHRAALAAAVALVALAGCESGPAAAPTRPGEPTRQLSPDQDVNRGQLLRQRGDLTAALDAFNDALAENPDLVDAHLGVGDVYRDQADYPRAERAYQRAAALDPTNFDAHYYLGLTRQFLGRINEAIASYRRAIALRPDAPEAHRDLAAAYLQGRRPQDALAAAERAVQLAPDDQPSWFNLAAAQSLTGDYEQAVQSYRRAAELGPVPDPIALGLADAHLKLGNLDRAVNTLLTLTANSPDSATAHERLGYAYFRQRKFDSADAAYEQAVQLNPASTSALNGLGATRMTQFLLASRDKPGDFTLRDQARALWRRSLEIDPNQTVIIDLLNRYAGL